MTNDTNRGCHTPALSLNICPSKDLLNRASCSSVLNPRYARDEIVSLFNLSQQMGEVLPHGLNHYKGRSLPFPDLSWVK